MKLTRRDLIGAAAGAAALRAIPGIAAPRPSPDAAAMQVLDRITNRTIAAEPESATYYGRDVGALAALRSRLGDRSPAGVAAQAARVRLGLRELDALDPSALGPEMRVNVEAVQAAYRLGIEGFGFGYGDVAVGGYRNSPYVVIQNVGAYIDVPRFLDSEHPLKSASDADAYLARLEAFPAVLDGETERLRIDRGKGVVAPDFLIDKAIRALALSHQGPPEGWQIVSALARRGAAIPGDHAGQAARIAAERIGPALDRQAAELARHRARADSRPSVFKLPKGEAYYAWALRAGTTTRMTPDEVHSMGREQLRDLEGQMEPILARLGYTQGEVGVRLAALGKDPRFTFPDSDKGREEILAIMRSRLAAMAAMMPRAFDTLVRSNVEVRRQLLAEEVGGAGAYGGPGSPDGRIPPIVWVNLRTPSETTRFSLPDLAYHEGIPGHGWQGQYAFKLPLIRSMLSFNAYTEGWALYAEQIADELGAYAGSPIERLGYLQSLAFRAARLVVDTGLHAKGWSRAQAVAWFSGVTGQDQANEVDRYCSWPGQACGYKVGHSAMNRLRDKAKAALGQRFDFRAFNDTLVGSGSVPITVLEGIVDRHIAARRA